MLLMIQFDWFSIHLLGALPLIDVGRESNISVANIYDIVVPPC